MCLYGGTGFAPDSSRAAGTCGSGIRLPGMARRLHRQARQGVQSERRVGGTSARRAPALMDVSYSLSGVKIFLQSLATSDPRFLSRHNSAWPRCAGNLGDRRKPIPKGALGGRERHHKQTPRLVFLLPLPSRPLLRQSSRRLNHRLALAVNNVLPAAEDFGEGGM
jgi:hypothetical protein